MKIAYMIAMVLGIVAVIVLTMNMMAEKDYSQMTNRGYVGEGIKKVEIDNKYVCFILLEYHGISCVQKVEE